ncbi:MAG: DUF2490 domain-containing protein [Pyrinomonadaceae bacterium]|nr:DUF2490 domain-containing protein [Pyrinomonadaceae bacterium]
MNLNRIAACISLALLLSVSAFSQAFVDENSDIVGWSDFTLIVPLLKKEENGKKVDRLTMNIGGVFRQGRDLRRPIDERGTVTFNYRFNKYFTAGTGYLYRRFRPTEAPRQYEHRLMFFLNAEKSWQKLVLKNRALTTFIIRHSRPDTVVYRNRIQANFPVRNKEKVIFTPFVADEPFYDFRAKSWIRNDIYAGITKQFTRNLGADFYYLNQRFRSGALRQINGFGVSFRYRLDRLK